MSNPRPDMETPEGELIDYEQWEALAPKLIGASDEDRLDILDAHEVTLEAWTISDRHWSLALADEVARDDWRRAERYGRLCAAQVAARRARLDAGPTEPGAALYADASQSVDVDVTAPIRFGGPRPALPFRAAGEPASPPPVAGASERRADLMGETRELGRLADVGDAVPFVSLAACAAVLERYAEFCARHGGARSNGLRATAGGAGIPAAKIAELHRSWLTRFAQDPALRARFEALTAHYRRASGAGRRGERGGW